MLNAQNAVRTTRSSLFLAVGLGIAGWPSPVLAQPTFRGIGRLAGGSFSIPAAVSDDGAVVAGTADGSLGNRVFRWAVEGGLDDLGVLPGFAQSIGTGISGNGLVIVGEASEGGENDPPSMAFRWTTATGMQALSGMPGAGAAGARDATFDGSVIVGTGEMQGPGQGRFAVRWTQPGQASAFASIGLGDTSAEAVSSDGQLVAGSGYFLIGPPLFVGPQAVRLSPSGGQNLGTLDADQRSYSSAITSDGNTIVGHFFTTAGDESAFIWTQATGMQPIVAPVDTHYLIPTGISHDGRKIVGWRQAQSGEVHAFFYTPESGVVNLNERLAIMGVDLTGWDLVAASAISGDGYTIVGEGVHNGLSEGWVANLHEDTDGDGLFDDWELEGIPYIDANGHQGLYIIDADGDGVSDADFRHKDLFVEVDSLPGRMISVAAQQLLVAAFSNAPITNPDGTGGIALHLQISDTNLTSASTWTVDPMSPGGWALDFDPLKTASFGTGSAQERAAKAKAFRYAICADRIDDQSLGTAELPGNDFFITLGGAAGPVTPRFEAGTFMHELGHTLGLRHGGIDDINGKPNYVSVMNYALTVPFSFSLGFWRLDYSREELDTLDEANLTELNGIDSALSRNVRMPYGVDSSSTGRALRYVRLNGRATDWSDNGIFGDGGVVQDLNYMGPMAAFAAVSDPSPDEQLIGFNDWAHIRLAIGTTGDFADFVHLTAPTDELTVDAVAWMVQTFTGPCAGDFNSDSVVNSQDFFDYIAAFFGLEPDADFNDDTVVNSQDFFDFLAAFFAGC